MNKPKQVYVAPRIEAFRFGAKRHLLATFSLEGDLDDFTPGGEIIEDSWD